MSLEEQLKKLEEDPENLDLLCETGKIYKQQGNFEKSREYYLKALEINKDYCPATCCLVNLLIDDGQYTEGFKLFDDAINSHQHDEQYRATLINALFAMFLLHKLSSEMATATGKHNYEELFFRMGATYKSQQLYEPAIKVYEEAYALSQSNARLMLDLSECYIQIDKFDRAEELLFKLREKYPEDKDILEILCLMYSRSGDYSLSINYAEKILESCPENEKVLNIMAYCYIKSGSCYKAIEIYKNHINRNKSVKAYRNLFLAYKISGMLEEAAEIFKFLKGIDKELTDLISIELEETKDIEAMIEF